LKVKDLILKHNISKEVNKSFDKTLDFWWLRLYKIVKVNNKSYYILKELGNNGS